MVLMVTLRLPALVSLRVTLVLFGQQLGKRVCTPPTRCNPYIYNINDRSDAPLTPPGSGSTLLS